MGIRFDNDENIIAAQSIEKMHPSFHLQYRYTDTTRNDFYVYIFFQNHELNYHKRFL